MPTDDVTHQTRFVYELKEELKERPGDPELLHQLGLAYARSGDIEMACRHWRKATAVDSGHRAARSCLGAALLSQGKLKQAGQVYQDAVKEDPSSPTAHNNLGLVLARQDQFEEALDCFRHALKANPNFGQAYYNMGLTYVRLGVPEMALEAFNKALDRTPDDVYVHNQRGRLYLSRDHFTQAEADFLRALELDPKDLYAHHNLGKLYARTGRPDEARRQFELALEIDPVDVYTRNSLGELMAHQGDVDEAINQFQLVLSHSPDDDFALSHLFYARHAVEPEKNDAERFGPMLDRLAGGDDALGTLDESAPGELVDGQSLVIYNDTTAVAMRYRRDSDEAPVVTAKGQRAKAQKLKSDALKRSIPVIEDKTLARSLAAVCQVGDAIPSDLYGPVADLYLSHERRAFASSEALPLLQVEPIALHLGRGLATFRAQLTTGVATLRRQLALELGIMLPSVAVRVSPEIDPKTYVIYIREAEDSRGELLMEQNHATILGHLGRVAHHRAADLLGLQEAEALLDNLRITHPALIKVLSPDSITLTLFQRVLQNLIRERVPIRDLVTVVETLVAHHGKTQDADVLTEKVREALSEAICRPYRDKKGYIEVIQLDPSVEKLIEQAMEPDAAGSYLAPDETQAWQILESLSEVIMQVQGGGTHPIVLTAAALRPRLRRATDQVFPHLTILSWSEISPRTMVKCVATVGI